MKRLDSLEASYRCCWWGFWLFIILLAVGWLTSCTTTKVTENAHSLYKSDSTQIQRLIDTRIRSIQQQMDSVWSERLNQYVLQQQQSEHQQETVTETVTTMTDSLGREIRKEQRTISRDITREQQVFEQRLTREFESRLETAMSELDSTWQMRYDELQAKGQPADYADILKNVQQRDYIDTHRETSPLRQAPDALVLDNSHMTIAEQDEWLMKRVLNVECLVLNAFNIQH